MRNMFVGALVVLLLAGTSMAGGAYTITSGGSSSLDVSGKAGQTITIVISLEMTEVGNFGWDGMLTGPGSMAAAASSANYANAFGYDTNVSATGGALSWAAGASLAAGLPIGATGSGLPGQSGQVFTCTIVLPPTVPAVGTGTWGVIGGPFNVVSDDFNFTEIPAQVTPLNLILTPEPISALLLLAGLPMLRRRR